MAEQCGGCYADGENDKDCHLDADFGRHDDADNDSILRPDDMVGSNDE